MTSQPLPRNLPSTSSAARLRLALSMAQEAELVGAQIRKLRKAKGLTQRELANAIPANPQASDVSRWERGKHLPNASTREHIAKALGVEIADLYAGRPRQKPGPSPDVIGTLNGSATPASRADVERVEKLVAQVLRNQQELQKAVQEFRSDQAARRKSRPKRGQADQPTGT